MSEARETPLAEASLCAGELLGIEVPELGADELMKLSKRKLVEAFVAQMGLVRLLQAELLKRELETARPVTLEGCQSGNGAAC